MEKRFIVRIKRSGKMPDKKQLGILARRLLDASRQDQKTAGVLEVGGAHGVRL